MESDFIAVFTIARHCVNYIYNLELKIINVTGHIIQSQETLRDPQILFRCFVSKRY
jgi:hypothetical protein